MGKGWRRVGETQLTCRIAVEGVEVEAEASEWTVLERDRRTELVERSEQKREGRPISTGGGRTYLVYYVL